MNPVVRKPLVIIGIGNAMRRDDGVGPVVADVFRSDPLENCDVVELDGEATRLIEAWSDRDLAIVIDAVCLGSPAGTIHDLRIDQLDDIPTESTTSSHYVGLAEALSLGRALGRLPCELRVLGIEPSDLKHGYGLSATVEASVDRLIDRVRCIVAARDPKTIS